MHDDDRPTARFQQFEKVVIADEDGRRHPGTILWRDLVAYRRFAAPGSDEDPGRWWRWEYAVDVPDFAACPTLDEDRLESAGAFDAEEDHLGRRFEVSFDTGLEDDNLIVEGSYRVPGRFWQVFVIRKEDGGGEPVTQLRHRFQIWESGITGIIFDAPNDDVVDRDYIFRAFTGVFGSVDWAEVRGPDSLLLK